MRAKIAKWGNKTDEVSEKELLRVEKALSNIRNDEEGAALFSSANSVVTILLNDIGANAALTNKGVVTVDINTELYFEDTNNNLNNTKFSFERILAHELVHAIYGKRDKTNITVQMTDQIMSSINGTQRSFYSNSCGSSVICFGVGWDGSEIRRKNEK